MSHKTDEKMKLNKTKLFLAIFIFSISISAQVPTSGDLRTHINSIISSMPDAVGGNQYQTPSQANLITWGNIIDDVINGNYSDAHTKALTINYQLLEYSDSESSSLFYVLENTAANYWGTFIYDPTPLRNRLFIQAPHPIKDFNTGKQAYHVFLQTGAKAFLMSGTSRCNSSTFSDCDGQTSICLESDALENYRISDQAHVVESTFQRTTERFETLISEMIYVQLHGFTKGNSDPYVIMSNGNNTQPPLEFNYLEILDDKLLLEDNSLTFEIAHANTGWDRLTGTTNTQGRFINGSIATPCTTSANINSGRFLHLEQEKDKLRADINGWTKMANALEATFLDLLPVELISFNAELIDGRIRLAWETATEINNYGFEIQRLSIINSQKKDDEIISQWEKIGFVNGHGNSNSPKKYIYFDELTGNEKHSYRLKQIDFDGKYEYSGIIDFETSQFLKGFELFQNYPNPFNPTTSIKFRVLQNEFVSLKVFDILGNEIITLVNETKEAGTFEVKFDGIDIPSGVYFYTLTSGNNFLVNKMSLIK